MVSCFIMIFNQFTQSMLTMISHLARAAGLCFAGFADVEKTDEEAQWRRG